MQDTIPNVPKTLRFDGGSRAGSHRSGCGAVLYDETGAELDCRCKNLPYGTNNVAEYEGLILGLQMAIERGVDSLLVEGDSMLVIQQMSGKWKINYPHLRILHEKATELYRKIPHGMGFYHVYRTKNVRADELANQAMDQPTTDEPLLPSM